jgi:hypothetical protein
MPTPAASAGELLNELKAVYELRRLEMELVEEFDYAFNWVMRVAEKNNLELPNREAMHRVLERTNTLMNVLYSD